MTVKLVEEVHTDFWILFFFIEIHWFSFILHLVYLLCECREFLALEEEENLDASLISLFLPFLFLWGRKNNKQTIPEHNSKQ